MKNRFFVINKEKIYAYLVSILTVIVIFFMTNMLNSDLKNTEETLSEDAEDAIIGEAIVTMTNNTDNEINIENNSLENNSVNN